jgi:hypothetical protein
MQCAPCQVLTDKEYWAERARRGGRLLYLEGADLELVAAGLREDDMTANGNASSKSERNAKIVEMRRAGLKQAEIASHFGITGARVAQIWQASQERAGSGTPPVSRAVVARPLHPPTRPAERIMPASVSTRAAKSPQELADALTERVLSVIDAFNLDFNLGNCLRLILERETTRGAEAERADLTWARKYLDRAIARLVSTP